MGHLDQNGPSNAIKEHPMKKEELEKALLELWEAAFEVKDERWQKGVVDTCKTLADKFGLTIGPKN